MKNKGSLLALLTAMVLMGDDGYLDNMEYHELTDDEKEQLTIAIEKKKSELLMKKGLNKYFYGQNVVWAINKKNADRKALKMGYL